MSEFDVPAWPDQLESGRDARHDNQPPLAERIALEFQESLDKVEPGRDKSLNQRITELLDSASKVPAITSEGIAGKVGDLIKMARDVEKRVEAARELFNRPLLEAQRGLKAKADAIVAPLRTSIDAVRDDLNRYMQEEQRKRDEAARIAAEEARKAQEEAARRQAEAGIEADIAPVIEEPKPTKPVARGDLGSRVGTVEVWHSEIESVRQLPDRLLKHPKVLEALKSVVQAEVRAGQREIKGVRIWSTHEARVR